MQNSNNTFGFKLSDHYEIHEINSTCYLYEHEKSGAKLMYLKNDDDNKVFSATFKTPPTDHTGVPHIVEHCVLSGSRKYHTREPFMDMVKGSMNTFINAMTFSDKTMYPVASKNTKDFFNLMDVYLDAVFFPKIHETDSIFMQEGWRYDIHAKDDPITYKGVVYNEMKGAYSDPGREVEFLMDQTLLKGTTYANESGGHPNHITSLTHEAFLTFHKTHYHPSNGYLFLYGDLDIEAALKHIDNDYLSHFTKKDIQLEIDTLNKTQGGAFETSYYAISDDESLENKDYMALGYVIGKATNPMTGFAASILRAALIDSAASPLRQALLEAGIAQDIYGSEGSGLYKRFQIVLKHTSLAHKDQFKNIVTAQLKSLCENGIDKNLLLSTINKFEYDLKEAEGFHTKGIIYHIQSMESWLYTHNATALLEYEKALNALRAGVAEGYFERFIEENLLSTEPDLVAIEPKKGLIKSQQEKDKATLEAYKATLDDATLDTLIEKNITLKEKQLNPDTPEALATIPKLSRQDVDRVGQHPLATVYKNDAYTLLHNNLFTSGIAYLDFFFDLNHLSQESISYAALIAALLKDMSTEDYHYGDLSNAVYSKTGGFSFSVQMFKHYHDANQDRLKFVVRTKTIEQDLNAAFEIGEEILLKTLFKDEKRLKELLGSLFASLQSNLIDSGNSYVSGRIASHLNPSDAKAERASGIAFYEFVGQLVQDFDSNHPEIIETLERTYKTLFTQNQLIVSFTGDTNTLKHVETLSDRLYDRLPSLTDVGETEVLCTPVSEGFKSSSNVQFVGEGFNFKALGHPVSGTLYILTALLNGDYLHNRVRAKGGAYGCGAKFDYTGLFTIASYRDPNLSETYTVYEALGAFIETLDISDEEIEKLIIGAMGKLDGAKTPRQLGLLGAVNHIVGKTFEDAQKTRESLLDTTKSDLLNLLGFVKDFSQNSIKCTLGNSDIVEDNKAYFDKIITLSC